MSSKNDLYDIVIIGAGPAGMTAAIYGLRAGKKVLVFEKKACGGQIVNAQEIENYPGVMGISGMQLAENMFSQVKELGGEVKFEQAVDVVALGEDADGFIVKTDESQYLTRAVIMAMGAENRKLGVTREKELIGRGVSYCATCDGHFYKGKDVVVVGGGNTALEDAIYLTNLANKVYLVHRRDEFRGEHAYEQELRSKKNVELVLKSNVVELKGEQKLEAVVVKNDAGETREIPASGMFVAVGYVPQNREFADIVELDGNGYIKTDDGMHTSTSGIYVAGDARVKELRQLTTAVSDGSIAANTAVKEMTDIWN